MTLVEINKRLLELAVEIPMKIKEVRAVETEYQLRFWELMLRSAMGNQDKREAEANMICNEENLYEPVLDLKADLRGLFNEKDLLLAISANLRVMEHHDYSEDGQPGIAEPFKGAGDKVKKT